MRLEFATNKDCELLYNWAIDDDVRANSLNSQKFSYENHCSWFSKRLNSLTSKMFICYDEDIAVGQIRLDFNDNEATISYSIAKEHRGKSYAKKMILLLENYCKENYDNIQLLAIVKNDNLKSKKIFEDLGYNLSYTNNLYGSFYKNLKSI